MEWRTLLWRRKSSEIESGLGKRDVENEPGFNQSGSNTCMILLLLLLLLLGYEVNTEDLLDFFKWFFAWRGNFWLGPNRTDTSSLHLTVMTESKFARVAALIDISSLVLSMFASLPPSTDREISQIPILALLRFEFDDVGLEGGFALGITLAPGFALTVVVGLAIAPSGDAGDACLGCIGDCIAARSIGERVEAAVVKRDNVSLLRLLHR